VWLPRRRRLVATLLLLGSVSLASAGQSDVERLFDSGATWDEFVTTITAQRDVWTRTSARVQVSAAAVARFRRVSAGLRLLVVAEDWCFDSAQVVPYVVALATSAAVPLRIVNRQTGDALMKRHPTPDGRPATPTIVVLRGPEERGGWTERPAVMQRWFLTMATDAESAKQFSNRQAWYEADQGRTTIDELIALAARSNPR
jgi:hypothetical protein